MASFTAGWNQPGYLPETEPEAFDDLQDALAYIDGELERIENFEQDDLHAIDAGAARNYFASTLDASGGLSYVVGGVAYWIAPSA